MASKAFLFALISFISFSSSILAEFVKVSVKGVTTIAETDNDFICATLDWWPSDKCDYGQCPWGKAGLLNLVYFSSSSSHCSSCFLTDHGGCSVFLNRICRTLSCLKQSRVSSFLFLIFMFGSLIKFVGFAYFCLIFQSSILWESELEGHYKIKSFIKLGPQWKSALRWRNKTMVCSDSAKVVSTWKDGMNLATCSTKPRK